MNEVPKMKVLCLWFTFTFFAVVKTEETKGGPKLFLQSVPRAVATRTVHGLLEPGLFYKSHVTNYVPVVMKKAFGDWDVSRLVEIPESFTTYLEMTNRGADTSRNASVYQILKICEEEDVLVDTPLPTAMKSQLPFPKSLLCKSVAHRMKRTRLIFSSGEWHREFALDPLHAFLCQFGGHSTFQILEPSAPPLEGEVSEYFTTILNKGDCIFIPSGWAHQQNSSGKYLSISMHWTAANSKEDASECDELPLGNLTTTSLFTEDPPVDLLSFIQFNELHHFIKEYYLHPSFMDLTTFMNAAMKDNYFAGVLKWDEEYKDVAEEMFLQLDYNADGSLSKEDFRDISKEDLKELAGKLDDRLADLADIVEDSKMEKKGSLFTEAKKATNSAEEIRKLIEDSFSDIFSDIDTAKRASSVKNLGLDSEESELKRIEKLLKDSVPQVPKSKKDEL